MGSSASVESQYKPSSDSESCFDSNQYISPSGRNQSSFLEDKFETNSSHQKEVKSKAKNIFSLIKSYFNYKEFESEKLKNSNINEEELSLDNIKSLNQFFSSSLIFNSLSYFRQKIINDKVLYEKFQNFILQFNWKIWIKHSKFFPQFCYIFNVDNESLENELPSPNNKVGLKAFDYAKRIYHNEVQSDNFKLFEETDLIIFFGGELESLSILIAFYSYGFIDFNNYSEEVQNEVYKENRSKLYNESTEISEIIHSTNFPRTSSNSNISNSASSHYTLSSRISTSPLSSLNIDNIDQVFKLLHNLYLSKEILLPLKMNWISYFTSAIYNLQIGVCICNYSKLTPENIIYDQSTIVSYDEKEKCYKFKLHYLLKVAYVNYYYENLLKQDSTFNPHSFLHESHPLENIFNNHFKGKVFRSTMDSFADNLNITQNNLHFDKNKSSTIIHKIDIPKESLNELQIKNLDLFINGINNENDDDIENNCINNLNEEFAEEGQDILDEYINDRVSPSDANLIATSLNPINKTFIENLYGKPTFNDSTINLKSTLEFKFKLNSTYTSSIETINTSKKFYNGTISQSTDHSFESSNKINLTYNFLSLPYLNSQTSQLEGFILLTIPTRNLIHNSNNKKMLEFLAYYLSSIWSVVDAELIFN